MKDPQEREILRKSLIEMNCVVRNANKLVANMIKHTLQFSISLPQLRKDAQMIKEILQEIPLIKIKLLRDLKMPEMEE